jgi:regulator of replication initiation timing
VDKILRFEVDEIKLIQELSDSQNAIAEVKVCHTGMNSHELPISIESLKQASSTLINKWLVAGWSGTDFKGHEGKEQRIIGFFPKENDFKYVDKNGKTYLVARAIVSKLYAFWAFDIFKKENFRECSMEIQVLETEQKEDGYEWIKTFIFNAVTVLGSGIHAACPGSGVEIIQFSENELIKIRDNISTKFSKSNQFQIPDIVKQNAQKGLLLKKNDPKGATSVNTAIANKLINAEFADLELINNIFKFSVHAKTDTAQFLLGGLECFAWIDKILNPKKQEGENVNFEKIEVGSGDYSIKVNKSKDALSDRPWGDINKSDLVRKVAEAKNAKSIVRKIFAKVESDWESSPSTKLGYPLMEVKSNNEAVYNKGALSSALGYAKAQNETAIVSKVEKIRKRLGLDTDDNKKSTKKEDDKMRKKTNLETKFSLNSAQIIDLCETELSEYKYKNGDYEYRKYWVSAFDDEYVYVYNNESCCNERMKYTFEDMDMDIDVNSAEEVICAGYMPIKKDDDEGEFTKTPEMFAKIKEFFSGMKDMMPMDYNAKFVFGIDKPTMKMTAIPYSYADDKITANVNEKKKVKSKMAYSVVDDEKEPDEDDFAVMMSMFKSMFTSDENTLAIAQAAMNEKEAEYNKKLSDMENQMNEMKKQMNPDMEKQMKDMMEKMSALEKENEELKKFKSDVEEKERTSRVEFTLTDVIDTMPKEKIDELREDSKNFSLENLTAWENKVKAEAYTFAKGKTKKDGFIRVGLPFSINDTQKTSSVWDNLK